VDHVAWFDSPFPVTTGLDNSVALAFEPFTLVVGHTHFGDLLLRSPQTGEFGILAQGSCTLFNTGYFDETEFRSSYVSDPGIVAHILRPSDVSALESRLGPLQALQIFLPVPIPALGGSDELSTYEVGGLWEYISFLVQTLGVERDIRA
jgi:hypothetical protein